MPEEYEVASLDAMRDMDEEDGSNGVAQERTYLFNIQTTLSVRAESLEHAEEILTETDSDELADNPRITIIENDVMFVEEN